MARASKGEVPIGSVVAIPLDTAGWALGQVWFPGTDFYLVVSCKLEREPLNASLVNDQTEFTIFSWTNAAEILRGGWKLIGAAPLSGKKISIPNYKALSDGRMRVWSPDEKYLRDYDEQRDDVLGYKKSRSPLLVEDAVKAQNGLLEWQPHLRRMLRP